MDKKQILLVDDNALFLEIMGDLLKDRGYEVTLARHGVEALNKAKEGDYDLILLDLLLPKLTGFEVLRQMREIKGDSLAPVLAVSGVFRKEEQLSYLREHGASGFISKNLSPPEIADRVDIFFDGLGARGREAETEQFPPPQGFDLSNLALFRSLNEAQRERLMDASRMVSFAPGQVIIREDDEGDKFYGIVAGHVRIEKMTIDGTQAVIATLGPGDEVGELALVDRERRSASCLAEDVVEAIEIGRSGFEKALAEDQDLELKCLRALVSILAERLRDTDVSLTFSKSLLDRALDSQG